MISIASECAGCGGRGWLDPPVVNAWPEACVCLGKAAYSEYELARLLSTPIATVSPSSIRRLHEGGRVLFRTAWTILHRLIEVGLVQQDPERAL